MENSSEYLLWQQSFGQDEEQSKQIFSQGILTMLYQIQDSITELKEQISKKGYRNYSSNNANQFK